tara:strand:+ start:612 stop:872 length:261 start_codon:yes stop_codon:yes gene_type:complete
MSNWVHLEITLDKGSKVSVKKAVESVWKGAEGRKDLSCVGKRETFFVSYRSCGVELLDDIKTILDNIKSWDNKSNPAIYITSCVVY